MTDVARCRWDKPYESFAGFYADVFGSCLIETRNVGRIGATLLRSDQSAGDWSDAAASDLSICRNPARAASAKLSLGGGGSVSASRLYKPHLSPRTSSPKHLPAIDPWVDQKHA